MGEGFSRKCKVGRFDIKCKVGRFDIKCKVVRFDTGVGCGQILSSFFYHFMIALYHPLSISITIHYFHRQIPRFEYISASQVYTPWIMHLLTWMRSQT